MRISERIYLQNDVITFSKTNGAFGGLSNMAFGYSLFVNETNIDNTEILYQACRFPLFPKIQEEIVSKSNPMEAKELSRKYNNYTRQDWEEVKFDVMRWCLQVKLIQNYNSFSKLLFSTQNKTIVEYSKNDNVWGAVPFGQNQLKGKNALGRLLMETREIFLEKVKNYDHITPLNIPAFLLFNNPIEKIYKPEFSINDLDEVYV